MARKKSYFTVTDKGQVTIPRAVRKRLGIEPGTQLTFEVQGNKILVAKAVAADPVNAVYGIAGRLNTDKIMARLRPVKR